MKPKGSVEQGCFRCRDHESRLDEIVLVVVRDIVLLITIMNLIVLERRSEICFVVWGFLSKSLFSPQIGQYSRTELVHFPLSTTGCGVYSCNTSREHGSQTTSFIIFGASMMDFQAILFQLPYKALNAKSETHVSLDHTPVGWHRKYRS